jgi:hypothetical protein
MIPTAKVQKNDVCMVAFFYNEGFEDIRRSVLISESEFKVRLIAKNVKVKNQVFRRKKTRG